MPVPKVSTIKTALPKDTGAPPARELKTIPESAFTIPFQGSDVKAYLSQTKDNVYLTLRGRDGRTNSILVGALQPNQPLNLTNIKKIVLNQLENPSSQFSEKFKKIVGPTTPSGENLTPLKPVSARFNLSNLHQNPSGTSNTSGQPNQPQISPDTNKQRATPLPPVRVVSDFPYGSTPVYLFPVKPSEGISGSSTLVPFSFVVTQKLSDNSYISVANTQNSAQARVNTNLPIAANGKVVTSFNGSFRSNFADSGKVTFPFKAGLVTSVPLGEGFNLKFGGGISGTVGQRLPAVNLATEVSYTAKVGNTEIAIYYGTEGRGTVGLYGGFRF